MLRNHVNVGKDHVERLSKTNPLATVEEMIWNALDSNSTRVEVTLRMNDIGAVQNIEIVDKGRGIHIDELEHAFGNIGESKKIKQKETSDGRLLHGREGRGRFKALSLSNKPIWKTVYKDDGKYMEYDISISYLDPDYYEYSPPQESLAGTTGTRLLLNNIIQGEKSLCKDDMHERLTRKFAYYLSNYPGVQIIYDGKLISVDKIIDRKITYPLPVDCLSGVETKLTIIEWKYKLDNKKIHLCNENGFCRYEMLAGVHAPGIDYTAYISSPVIEMYYSDGLLVLEDMHQDLQEVIEVAKEKLREHVRERLAEEAVDVVTEWKELDIYPYEGETANPIKKAEREVFDIVAVRLNDQHPTFKKTDTDNKKLTLALIKQALETNPSSLTSILKEIIQLPESEQDAFAELLKRTTLSSIIRASSIVAQRLDTISAFEHVLFDADWKKTLLERTQLHRLLVHELWIFGEDYTLDNDDESLTEVLKKHVGKLGRSDLVEDCDVKTIEGVAGIPDLLLSRRFAYSRDQFENLVVELKRPSVILGQKELSQIEDYAITVAKDERFKTIRYRWRFILIGNQINDLVAEKSNQDGLPENCTYKSKDGNVSVYVFQWADILAEAKQRYEFFRENLEIEAKKEAGMSNWYQKYQHLLEGRGASKKKDKEITLKNTVASIEEH